MATPAETSTPILIADDGELVEVRGLVAEMGHGIVEPGSDGACSATLWIGNVRWALVRHGARDAARADAVRFSIVVVEKLSWGLRRQVERTGPDFLLERPVDPGVLRLLIERALHRPPARRRFPRGLYRRSVVATNAAGSRVLLGRDLSVGGMRVARDASLAVGDAFRLAVHGGGGCPAVVVKASVARDDGERGLVLRFDALEAHARDDLARIVEALPASSPADVDPSGPLVVVSERVEEPGAAPRERR
jgi:hypothetical protein